MNFDAFAKTLGGHALPPTDNLLGASNGGLLANYAKGAYLASASDRSVGAGTAQAGVQAANQRQAEEYSRKQQVSQLADKAQAIRENAEGKNYQKVPKDDGGYDFFDGTGRPVNVQQFARATGKTPSQVLSQSDNSLDQQYIKHFDLTQKLASAISNQDVKTRDKLYEQNPGLKEAVHGMTGEQIVQQFIKAYPHIYGGDQAQTPMRSLGQDLGGKSPQPGFNPLNPSTYGPAAGSLFKNLSSSLLGG